jgi:hypothetical protein
MNRMICQISETRSAELVDLEVPSRLIQELNEIIGLKERPGDAHNRERAFEKLCLDYITWRWTPEHQVPPLIATQDNYLLDAKELGYSSEEFELRVQRLSAGRWGLIDG